MRSMLGRPRRRAATTNLASGMYLARLVAGQNIATRKFSVVR